MPKVTRVGKNKHKNTGRIADRIKPLKFDDDTGLKINLYGRSATGKTTLWATFPKPILALVCSGGSDPGELRSIDTREYRKTISQLVINESSDIEKVAEYQASTGKYATITLDHATGLQDVVLKEVLGLDKVPEQLSWGLASQTQYGQVALQMKERLRSLLNLKCNVVIIAQEREFNLGEEANSLSSQGSIIFPFVASALTPSVTGWLNPACDYICQTFIRQRTKVVKIKVGEKTIERRENIAGVDYCLRTGPDPTYTIKFRVPKGSPTKDVIVDPTYQKLYQLIKGG